MRLCENSPNSMNFAEFAEFLVHDGRRILYHLIDGITTVFKITLPCSGKRTDEVDVQVLINISGMVPVETNNNDMISGDQEGTVSPAQDQLNADMQLASMTMARQQLATAQQMATGDININSTDGMQSDEAVQPMMRLVSHTLVIKRKKICTMHPVPIQPTPKVWPANQPTTRVPQVGPMHGDHPTAISTAPSTAMPPANKWQDIPAAPMVSILGTTTRES